jgi:hypothetical protein
MPMYRKKPVTVEAWQIPDPKDDKQNAIHAATIAAWCESAFTQDAMGFCIIIDTDSGQHRAEIGDWVVKGTGGEFYPVKPERFAEIYEAA